MKYIKFLTIIFCFFISNANAYAMQTIFNVPSADVTEKGHVFFQEEAQTTPWNTDTAYLGTTYGAYGIGHNTEIDTTLYNVASPANQNISIGAGFKSAIPIPYLKDKFPEREYKLTVGSQMLFGLEGNGVGNWTYAHLSGRVPKLNTRLTAGLSYGTHQVFGKDTFSFIAGVEQPVTKNLNIIGDWFSGSEHFAGFLIVGTSYSFKNNVTLYTGYQIPNSPKVGTSGFVIELAKIF